MSESNKPPRGGSNTVNTLLLLNNTLSPYWQYVHYENRYNARSRNKCEVHDHVNETSNNQNRRNKKRVTVRTRRHDGLGRFTSRGYCRCSGGGGGGSRAGSELPAAEGSPDGIAPTLEAAPDSGCDCSPTTDMSFGSSSHDWYAGGSRPDAERWRKVTGPPSWCRSSSSSCAKTDGGIPSRPANLDGREEPAVE